MSVAASPSPATELSAVDEIICVLSSQSQVDFLSGLRQFDQSSSPTWVLGPGVASKGLPGTTTTLDADFGRARSLRGSKAQARDMVRQSKAAMVLTGSGPLALPFLLAARDLSIGSIFLESPDAATGRRSLVARLADRTVVEWEHQLTRHPFATVLGETL